MDLDLATFARIHLFLLKEDAKSHIQNYSMSALAFGGDKKTVKKHLKPYHDILSVGAGKTEPKKANGLSALVDRFGKGF